VYSGCPINDWVETRTEADISRSNLDCKFVQTGRRSHVKQLALEIPDETMLAMRRSPEEVGARLLMAAGAKLFELGELSSGAAAAIAGLPRVVFLSKLAEFGVDTFCLSEAEILRERRLA
jgi:Uncharacterised protein family (UPF0175)